MKQLKQLCHILEMFYSCSRLISIFICIAVCTTENKMKTVICLILADKIVLFQLYFSCAEPLKVKLTFHYIVMIAIDWCLFCTLGVHAARGSDR